LPDRFNNHDCPPTSRVTCPSLRAFPAAPALARRPFGLVPNHQHQPRDGAVFRCPTDDGRDYMLAIVEFDDQGLCYCRPQMQALLDLLRALKGHAA
jgi:hypothetical protein